ncbi:T9SS type A sorting domain-containing protein [Dyadobacter flavalbus]|uniref:T9SS type A sorting domain-containing protein n=1 Tax=Dyadobacter flavalbus TaxID=2579942 RepID=A0A5M8QVQ4_9BACT|nr:T9SS type A sorting domain-containing protein [Dyadobacter flavalbus]KAA6440347.1 T9SS type A sorting domain-containing protein [Dyadobacter flavalbus]
MKRKLLHTAALMFSCFGLVQAQFLPKVNTPACLSCVPAGWHGSSVPAGHMPSVSKNLYYGSPYKLDNFTQVDYSFAPTLPAAPSGKSTFLSINNTKDIQTSAFSVITGLVKHHRYKVNFSLSTARIHYNHKKTGNQMNYAVSGYAKSAKVSLSNGAFGSEEVVFTPGTHTDKWVPASITFTALDKQADLHFTGTGSNASPGIANLDFPAAPVQPLCSATPKQIALKTNKVNAFYSKTFDLASSKNIAQLPVGTPDNIPDGFSVKVFDNPNHTGSPVKTISKTGTFYYFFYDEVFGCYNTDHSTAKLTVEYMAEVQVPLKASTLTNTCPQNTANLNNAVATFNGSSYPVVWFDNPTHSGLRVRTPEAATTGTYYAFFYDVEKGYFLTDHSVAKVKTLQCVTPVLNINARTAANEAPENSGIQDTDVTSEINVYPNPVSDLLNIESADWENVSAVQIYNANGKQVYQSGSKPANTVDTKNLPAGTYRVKVSGKDHSVHNSRILIVR